MIRHTVYAGLTGMLLLSASCASHYRMTGIERTRILVDASYDNTDDPVAKRFLAPYKQKVDSVMSPVVGHLASNMKAQRPESDLSNLLADIMVWAGKKYGEKPVVGIYNMGGIRAALSKGVITYGDVIDVAPFENRICFLTLSGEKLMQLFREIASVNGEGVSHGVRLVITHDRKLKSATLNGQPVDPQGSYRVATIDYLAEGNDKLTAFKDKTDFSFHNDAKHDARCIIADFFREKEMEGVVVDSKVEGRITVE